MCLDEYMTFKSMGSSNYATSHSNKILKLLLMAITKNRFRMALKILLKSFYVGLSLGNNVFYAISSGVGFLCYIAFAFSWWISLLFYSSSISKWHHTSYLSEIFFVFVKIKKKNVLFDHYFLLPSSKAFWCSLMHSLMRRSLTLMKHL